MASKILAPQAVQHQAVKSAHGDAHVLLVAGKVSSSPSDCWTLHIGSDLCFAFKYCKERGRLINVLIVRSTLFQADKNLRKHSVWEH